MVVVGGFGEVWGLPPVWDEHIKDVRRMFSQEGILTITGEPFYRSVSTYLNTQKQHFKFDDSLAQKFIMFFDNCIRMLGSATVDVIERNALPFSKKYQREYRAYPARVWVHPNFMPARSQNEPRWDDEDQVPSGEPLAPVAPPPGWGRGG